MDDQKQQWEAAYQARQNYVFVPHEEVVRFLARHVRRRVGLAQYEDVQPFGRRPRLLDLGCGIGRHVVYAHTMGLEAYGIDLAESAVGVARDWAAAEGLATPAERIVVGGIDKLPWADGFFDVVVSHGVLDSMGLELAEAAVGEVARVLADGGLFYCDLVSGDDTAHAREFAGEEIVQTAHEQGTVQSYFNFAKIERLFADRLTIRTCTLIRQTDVLGGGEIARYHLVLAKERP